MNSLILFQEMCGFIAWLILGLPTRLMHSTTATVRCTCSHSGLPPADTSWQWRPVYALVVVVSSAFVSQRGNLNKYTSPTFIYIWKVHIIMYTDKYIGYPVYMSVASSTASTLQFYLVINEWMSFFHEVQSICTASLKQTTTWEINSHNWTYIIPI